MSKERRAAARDVRDAAPDAGVYAVRIGGAVWVGAALRLRAAENRMRFMLRTGGERAPGMAAAYAKEGDLRFEVLERLDEDLRPMTRERLLNEKSEVWRNRLEAMAI